MANLNKSPNAGRMSAADANRTIVNAGRKKTQATTTIVQQIGGGGASSSVTVTAPLQMSGSVVSIPQATGSVSGYLLSADWTTFNAKMTNPMTTAGDLIVGGASGVPARLGIGTSTYVLTSNGTTASWQAAGGGGGSGFPTVALTKPVAADFSTWINQSSAAVADGTTGLVYYTATAATGAGGGYGSQVYKAFGGGVTTWEIRFDPTFDYGANLACGLALYETGSTKATFFGYIFISGSGGNVYKAQYTGSTRNSFTLGANYNGRIPPWFRARISAGTIYYEYSSSGEANDWILLTSAATTTDFTTTPDSCGFFMINSNPGSFVIQSALAY